MAGVVRNWALIRRNADVAGVKLEMTLRGVVPVCALSSESERRCRRTLCSRLIASLVVLGCWGGPAAHSILARSHPSPSYLVQELQSDKTTDRARRQLLRLGKSEPDVRQYLAVHLPAIIKPGPDSCPPSHITDLDARWHSCPWYNAVELAGNLRIGEAAPALARWFGWRNIGGSIIGLSSELSLEPYVAARALAEIGDPAIPSIQPFLSSSRPDEHARAVRVLCMIHSSMAKIVLRDDLQHAADPELRTMINSCLGDSLH